MSKPRWTRPIGTGDLPAPKSTARFVTPALSSPHVAQNPRILPPSVGVRRDPAAKRPAGEAPNPDGIDRQAAIGCSYNKTDAEIARERERNLPLDGAQRRSHAWHPDT